MVKKTFFREEPRRVLPHCLIFHVLSQWIELLVSFWGYLPGMQYICSRDLSSLRAKMNIVIPTLTGKLKHKKAKQSNRNSTKYPQVPVSSTGHPAGGYPSGSQTSLFQKILTLHLRLDWENKAEPSKAKFQPHSNPYSNSVQFNT